MKFTTYCCFPDTLCQTRDPRPDIGGGHVERRKSCLFYLHCEGHWESLSNRYLALYSCILAVFLLLVPYGANRIVRLSFLLERKFATPQRMSHACSLMDAHCTLVTVWEEINSIITFGIPFCSYTPEKERMWDDKYKHIVCYRINCTWWVKMVVP